ncbi:MAG TPA: isoleucine--tRNA ligase [Thermodesulfobacteriota bacterium]|nr:isoleucine--tRNA ligase [Deltaproteobacteria bacterium]HNR12529.1 isoleucine--tRNA ligase [Thermodesulfobacteriota bacterium]HNU71234.1 isoleucine--tRNA ligase [Thermodesulfobacteriota bacterium]
MDYKDTINLPATAFPQKANLPQKEPEMLKHWESMDIYHCIEAASGPRGCYILHDGPPYANGHIHMGHGLNKILKDFINKSKFMMGFGINYTPGWDCHGLPIEHEVDKKLGAKKKGLLPTEVRLRCREYAEKFVAIQREEFMRLGVFGDWSNPYLTMSYDYQATIVREFGTFVEKDSIYRRKKPIQWCATCHTALAEAEVEYQDDRSSSIYVAFPLVSDISERLPELTGKKNISVVIWTTTPWTIPANLAICVHPDFVYVAVQVQDAIYIVADGMLKELVLALHWDDYRIIASFPGTVLEGLRCRHPYIDRDSLLILGTHVTLEAGTGCVHTAPGHGQEDYEIGLKYNLDIYAPVNDQGRFTDDVASFAGQYVFDANKPINDRLRAEGKLVGEQEIVHSYPHCWRCKNPIIFRATEQWFVSMERNAFRKKVLDIIRGVQWIPAWGEERIYGMVENRPDWCISRQRSWGVPIVAFYCSSCREPLVRKDVIDHVADIFEKEGADAWFSREAAELLPRGIACPACGGQAFEKEKDILDVWFDSGVSYAAVAKSRKNISLPVDLYLEGSDQHRGWFQSSLLTGSMNRGMAPYKTVLTHGFVVDGEGKKMSKSQGNIIHPNDVITKYGAEVLRLWVAAEDYRDDIRISQEILQRLSEAYRRFRNTCRFLLGNLSDFNPDTDRVAYTDMEEIDRWALHRLQQLTKDIQEAYTAFEFHRIYHRMHNFCVVDMSAFYLDVLKDRLYCDGTSSRERRSAQTALYEILVAIVKLYAPIQPFTTEEVWLHLVEKTPGLEKSIHLSRFPGGQDYHWNQELDDRWNRLLELREQVNQKLEHARRDRLIGSSLAAEVVIQGTSTQLQLLSEYVSFLPTLFIVSRVSLVTTAEGNGKELTIVIRQAPDQKCERCWNFRESVGKNPDHPTICERCWKALET